MDFIRMFNLIDTDQSGEITRSELIKFMHENNFTESFVDKWLILFDFNQRGRITMDDFCERLGLVIDENMHKQLDHHRPSFINLDDLDDFVDVDDKMEQQIIHVSTNKPISTPIKRNFNSQENVFEDFPVMKEIEKEVITKKFTFPLFGMAQSDTNPEKNRSKNEHKSHDPSEIQTNSSNSRKALSLPKSPESANEKSFNLPVEQTNSQSEIDKTHRKRANTLKSSSPRTKASEKSPKFADFFNFSKLKIKSSENKPKSSTLNPNKTQKNYNDNNFTSKVTSLDRKKDKMNKTDGQSTSTDVQNTQNNFNTELDNEHKKNHSFVKGFSQHKRNNEKGESLTNISIIIDADKKSENQKKEKTRKSFLKLFHQKDKKSPTKEDDKQDKISKETEKTKINTEHHKNLRSENVSEIIFDNKPNSKAKSTQENRRSFLDSENRTETEPVYKEEQLKNKLDELMKLDNTNIKCYISNEENLKMKNRQEFEKEMDKMILDGKNAKHVHSKISNEEPPNNNSRHKGSKDVVSDSIERNSEELFKLSSLELNIPDYVSKIPEDKNNLLTLSPINPADKDNIRYLNSKSPDGIDKNNYPVIDPAKKDLQRKYSEDFIEEVITYQVNFSLGSQLPDMVDKKIDDEFFANNKGWHDLDGKKRNFDMDKRFPGKRNDTDQMETTNKMRENPPKDFPDGSRNPNKLNENKENLQNQYSVENDQEDKSNLEIVESLYPEKNINFKETESLKDDTTEEILHKSIPTEDPFSIIEEDQPGTSDPETENIHKIENESKINLENKKSSILNEDDLSKNFKIILKDDNEVIKENIELEDSIRTTLQNPLTGNPFNQEPDNESSNPERQSKPTDKTDFKLDGKICNEEIEIDKNLLKSPKSLKTGSNESRVLKENTDLNKGPQVSIDSISTEIFDKNLIKNESKIRNNTDDRILLKQQLTNSSNENIVPVYSKIHRPNGKITIIHKDFGRNDYPNLVEDVVKVYEESKSVDDWNGHELIKGYLDKYYERIWSVIIVNSAYELYVTYENMVIFKYDSFTFIIWKTIEPL